MRNINNSDNRINVDNRNYSTIARFRQEDDATLVLNLFKGGTEFDASNQTITLRALRADGQSVNQTDNITKNKNIVIINLRRNILAVIGRTSIQLNISDSAGQFTTSEFFIEIEKNNLGSDALKGSDNIQALHQILIDFKAEKNSLIKNITDDYNSLKKIIIDQNQAANLQNQINLNKQQLVENTSRIEQLEDLTPVWQAHEGVGSVTVNDSFDAITKDLVIKGRTVKNEAHITKFNRHQDGKVTLIGNQSMASGNSKINLSATNLKPNTKYSLYINVESFTTLNKLVLLSAPTTSIESTIVKDVILGKIRIDFRTKTDFNGVELAIYIQLDGSDTNGNIVFKESVLVETINSFNCSYFDSITSAGELEDNKIKIKSVGKNLFNKHSNELSLGVGYSGTQNIGTSSNSEWAITEFIQVKPNTTYYKSGNAGGSAVHFFDKNKGWLNINGVSVVNGAFTTPSNCHYIRTNTRVVSLDTLLIEEDTKATNYEQYRSKLIEIPLSFQKGLKSTLDGSVYDEINGNTGEIIQRVSDEYTALSKPVIHKITDVQLSTFDETTHITQENNILSDISFKAKVSLSSQSKRLSEENKALKEENRELREDTNTIVDSLISVFEPMLLPYDDNAEEEQKIILEKLYAIKNR